MIKQDDGSCSSSSDSSLSLSIQSSGTSSSSFRESDANDDIALRLNRSDFLPSGPWLSEQLIGKSIAENVKLLHVVDDVILPLLFDLGFLLDELLLLFLFSSIRPHKYYSRCLHYKIRSVRFFLYTQYTYTRCRVITPSLKLAVSGIWLCHTH